jgi:hypothetical protein
MVAGTIPFLTPSTSTKELLMLDQIAKFTLGRTVATPNAVATIPHDEILLALLRHALGDWGTLDKEDWQANERALRDGGRLFSLYHTNQDVRFYVITECDRAVTTVLLPEDY